MSLRQPGMSVVTLSSSDDDGNNTSGDDSDSKQRCTKASYTYTDRSQTPPVMTSPPSSSLSKMGSSRARVPSFPAKLHMILSSPDFHDIVAWLPHGRSWRVLQRKAFEERVIPLYFRHRRYSSFVRQVNGWGFRRVRQGSDCYRNVYYHELCLRGLPHLCDKMQRIPTNGIRARKRRKVDYGPAPDFYAFSREFPLPYPTLSHDGRGQSNDLASSEARALETRRSAIINRIMLVTAEMIGCAFAQELRTFVQESQNCPNRNGFNSTTSLQLADQLGQFLPRQFAPPCVAAPRDASILPGWIQERPLNGQVAAWTIPWMGNDTASSLLLWQMTNMHAQIQPPQRQF